MVFYLFNINVLINNGNNLFNFIYILWWIWCFIKRININNEKCLDGINVGSYCRKKL